jgi:hypothetical protein
MEDKEDRSGAVVDLSDVLNEGKYEREYTAPSGLGDKDTRNIPGLYRLMMKLSGGLIKTQSEAMWVAVLLILVANLITFTLLYRNSSNQAANTAPLTIKVSH